MHVSSKLARDLAEKFKVLACLIGRYGNGYNIHDNQRSRIGIEKIRKQERSEMWIGEIDPVKSRDSNKSHSRQDKSWTKTAGPQNCQNSNKIKTNKTILRVLLSRLAFIRMFLMSR
jgi:hypothetical protein